MAVCQDVLAVGKLFDSFEALKSAIEKYEKMRLVQFYKRSSRSVTAYAARCPKRQLNPQLKYSEIDYACIHGGKKFKSKSTGVRPYTSTSQMECPAVIKLRSTMDGQYLVVKAMNDQHNHGVSEGKIPRDKYGWNDSESLPSMAVGFHWLQGQSSTPIKQEKEEIVVYTGAPEEIPREPMPTVIDMSPKEVVLPQPLTPEAPPPLEEIHERRNDRDKRSFEQAFGDMVAHELEQIQCRKIRQKAKLRIQEVIYEVQLEADDVY